MVLVDLQTLGRFTAGTSLRMHIFPEKHSPCRDYDQGILCGRIKSLASDEPLRKDVHDYQTFILMVRSITSAISPTAMNVLLVTCACVRKEPDCWIPRMLLGKQNSWSVDTVLQQWSVDPR
jgi:hypothetical protein